MNKQPKYLNNIKKVYFSGIGGIGVSALAKMMLSMHKKVFGSDIARSEITDKLQKQGATIVFKQVPENITKDIDLFIYSPAEDSNHPERKQAKKLKIKQYSYSEFLGLISKDYNTISICGTHGKSTTTALTG
ncbi:MAG TPA: Mur ligase domain-containing protein [Candidatus Paceibacterota bacterium]|jgi:UDP-N-acetylmuramate--alanine ligase|nr:Mur ligase domain-containing protein [Candidatus Paceibacterota bacterium]